MSDLIKNNRDFLIRNKPKYLKDNLEIKEVDELYRSLFIKEEELLKITNKDIDLIKIILKNGISVKNIIDDVCIQIIKNINIMGIGEKIVQYKELINTLNTLIENIDEIEKIERAEIIKIEDKLKIKGIDKISDVLFIYKGLYIKKDLKFINKKELIIEIEDDILVMTEDDKKVYINMPKEDDKYFICRLSRKSIDSMKIEGINVISKDNIHNRSSFRLNTLTKYKMKIGKINLIVELFDISKDGVSFIIGDKRNIKVGDTMEIRLTEFIFKTEVRHINMFKGMYKIGLEYIDNRNDDERYIRFLNKEQIRIIRKIKKKKDD